MPTHFSFPYFFSDDEGITFGWPFHYNYDLLIYYDTGPEDYIDCRCSRWDTDNYTVIVESWLTKDQLTELRSHIVPGAAGELYRILGKPFYYDKTWQRQNTLVISSNAEPEEMVHSNLANMRDPVTVYVKNYIEHPIEGSSGWTEIRIEGLISGQDAVVF